MLRIQVGKSRLLAMTLAAAHAIAVACMFVSLPPGVALPGAAVIAASAIHHLRLHALQLSDGAIVELLLRESGSCELLTRGGMTLTGRVQGSTFVSPWLIVINIRLDPGRHRRSLVLVRGSAATEALRKLRVWLRYRCAGKPPESAAL
jgi:toxin CptA